MALHHLALAAAILCNSASLVLFKMGINDSAVSGKLDKIDNWLHLVGNGYFILGVVFFVIASVSAIFALSTIDLSLAYPTWSCSYVIVAIMSVILLKEAIPIQRWIGIGVIIIGILIMYMRK